MKLFILIFVLSQILFSQCDSLPYDQSEYYHYTIVDIDHIGSTLDCYYIDDWDILNNLITINNLSDIDVAELGYQNWDSNGRLKNFTLNYSSFTSGPFINQKINILPDNFGNLEMLETLEMYYHDLTVFPLSFPQLENLKALNMKGNKIKILNPDFGSLSSLEVLDLGYNDLVALPESISSLNNVNYFWIFGNDISYIPDSVCELEIDWSGELGDFIYFGSGGNHLCEDVPDCIENSIFFNIMLEEEGYAFQIESDQVCPCYDGSYPDCIGYCPNDENYGFIIDACGLCSSLADVCTSDCTGIWGGLASIDECGICDGDSSACAEIGTLSIIDNSDDNWLINYNSPFSISSIYFEIEGAKAIEIEGVGSNMFFPTIVNEIIEGSFFPTVLSGQGTILSLLLDGIPTSLYNIQITDSNNSSHSFLFDDGNLEVCVSDYDCLGACGGSATIDECGVCDGIGASVWYADNDGDGFGDLQNSGKFCYQPNGYISNADDSDDSIFCPYQNLGSNFDCYGNCNVGVDCSGECGGLLEVDCLGECGGNQILDKCGICSGDNSSCTGCMDQIACNYNPIATLSGTCEYSQENFDCSGNCNVGVDCKGICGGTAEIDICGICDGGIEDVLNCIECPESAPSDCAGVCGGSAILDECDICSGDNASCTGCMNELACNYSSTATIGGACEYSAENFDCSGNCNVEVDCVGVCGGTAWNSDCGCVPFGNSGDDCDDCAGTPYGDAVLSGCDNKCASTLVNDECGECGGDTSSCTGCIDPSANNYVGAFDFEITVLCADLDGDSLPDCCTYDLSTELLDLPTEFTIMNNYPNPFNPETTIIYSIPQIEWISLSIYDVKGELVLNIFEGFVNPGNYSVIWNGNNFRNQPMPTGIYFSVLRSNENLVSHKLLLMK